MHDDEMASDPAEYWARRRTLSPSPVTSTVADGDRRLSVVADVSGPEIGARSRRLLDRLDDFSCLRVTPVDDLHLTVKLFNAGRGHGERIDADRVRRLVDRVTTDAAPFEVRFPRLNLFPDAVYAEADAEGALVDLNRAFCRGGGTTDTDRDGGEFIPHLTLGYFTGTDDYDDLVDAMEADRDPGLPPLTVEELAVVSFDTTADRATIADTIATYTL